MIRYCEPFGYGGQTLSTHVSNDLAHVSVPAEDGSNMPLRDQHSRAHSRP
jgi:hypothetical protein